MSSWRATFSLKLQGHRFAYLCGKLKLNFFSTKSSRTTSKTGRRERRHNASRVVHLRTIVVLRGVNLRDVNLEAPGGLLSSAFALISFSKVVKYDIMTLLRVTIAT